VSGSGCDSAGRLGGWRKATSLVRSRLLQGSSVCPPLSDGEDEPFLALRISSLQHFRISFMALRKKRLAAATLRFSELTGVRAMIETWPLEKAGEAYARMLSGNAEFRVVLTR